MKKVILTIASLFAASASAATVCDQSWEQINGNYRLWADFDKVTFQAPTSSVSTLIQVSVDGVCTDGEKVFTKTPVRVCMERGRNERGECVKDAAVILATDINYSKLVPGPGERGELIAIPQVIPMTYQVPVGSNGGEVFRPSCTKEFTIPACNQ